MKVKFLKWLKTPYRSAKAIYYKREIFDQKMISAIPRNYALAKKLFTGYFGNITYQSPELMVCYKNVHEYISIEDYAKMRDTFRDLGFDLSLTGKPNNLTVCIVPEINLQKYRIDVSFGTENSNIESLAYMVN